MAKGCGCGMGAVRKPAKRKTKKASGCTYLVGVEGAHGVANKVYKGFATRAAATKRARHASRQGYQAVVRATCGTKTKTVAVCNMRKCHNVG